MYQQYLNRIQDLFASVDYVDEVRLAKQEYCRLTGEFHEDDLTYELRLSSFLDWYIFERPMSEDGRTPVSRYLVDHRKDLKEEERAIYRGLTETIHSIFELRKIATKELHLLDLIEDEKRMVYAEQAPIGVGRGDIFEARLIPVENHYFFAKGFCFFPREVRNYIRREARLRRDKLPSDKKELLCSLSYKRLMQDRYRHVDIHRIYSDEGPKPLSLQKARQPGL